jgi:hypothetical protein
MMTKRLWFWHHIGMAKKLKKSPSDLFEVAHEVAEAAIGGPLFRPQKVRLPRRKRIKTAKKTVPAKVKRRKSKTMHARSRGITHKR